MSRRRKCFKRNILTDPKYNSLLLGKFINILMIEGKKSLARSILYRSFEIINSATNEDPLKIFKKAIEKVRPLVEVKSRRVGGANYQVPIEVNDKRGTMLSFRWLKLAARSRNENSMYMRLANEILAAYNNEGEAIRKKEQMHKMADANKAFAHYLW